MHNRTHFCLWNSSTSNGTVTMLCILLMLWQCCTIDVRWNCEMVLWLIKVVLGWYACGQNYFWKYLISEIFESFFTQFHFSGVEKCITKNFTCISSNNKYSMHLFCLYRFTILTSFRRICYSNCVHYENLLQWINLKASSCSRNLHS